MGITSHLRTLPAFALGAATLSLAVATSPAALGQSPVPPSVALVEPPVPLLPQQFGTWQQTAQPDTQTDDAASSAIFAEDGLTRSAAATYNATSGPATVRIRVSQFGDVTGAFSAFTYLRSHDDHPLKESLPGTTAVENGDRLLIWKGPAVVVAEFQGAHRAADLAPLVANLPKALGAKGQPPLLPNLPPAKGLEVETLKYALGPAGYQAMAGVLPAAIVGFDKSAETVTARYAGRGLLTLLLYPTPQIAGDHGREIEAEMNRQGAAAGTVKLRREGPLLLLTTGSWTPTEAQRLIENIHLDQQLTYDKKMPLEFHAEVQKTASLLVSIAELSGVLMLAAVVLGLFFGGGRAMVRVLQGKPAAREPEFLRIDLRSRPSDGSDFKPLH